MQHIKVYILRFCIAFLGFFSDIYAEIYGPLTQEEWQYTYNFCMQNNVNACDFLINNGLVSAQNCYNEQCDTVGMIYTLAGRYDEALPYFEKSCGSGNIASCGNVADMYYFYLKDYFSNLQLNSKRGVIEMATVPEAQEALNRFKMEAASEVGVNLKQGYNGDLTSKQAGSVGGQMVKKMIKAYEESMK